MGIERQEKVFQKLKERFTKELVLIALDLDKKNEDKSRCIGLCYKRGIIHEMQRWEIKASSVSLKISK